MIQLRSFSVKCAHGNAFLTDTPIFPIKATELVIHRFVDVSVEIYCVGVGFKNRLLTLKTHNDVVSRTFYSVGRHQNNRVSESLTRLIW